MKAPAKKAFRLPMTTAFLSFRRPKDGKAVAHSLDFDLVAVADDEDLALDKLRLAVKTYIEYGISNCWTDDIMFPAPTEYWERFQAAKTFRTMEPIGIDDDRMIVVRATIADHEHIAAPCTA